MFFYNSKYCEVYPKMKDEHKYISFSYDDFVPIFYACVF